jgi:hypothetical protein
MMSSIHSKHKTVDPSGLLKSFILLLEIAPEMISIILSYIVFTIVLYGLNKINFFGEIKEDVFTPAINILILSVIAAAFITHAIVTKINRLFGQQ